jgi:hypothetical protein
LEFALHTSDQARHLEDEGAVLVRRPAPLIIGLSVALAGGCECGSPSIRADASVPDGGADAGSEPCGQGIRAVSIDIPPLDSPVEASWSLIRGAGPDVWIAQTDYDDGYVGRLTVARASDGQRVRFARVQLPFENRPRPSAIRAVDGAIEVLWTAQGDPFAAVVRFAETGGATVTPIDHPAGETIYEVDASASDDQGYFSIGRNSSWFLIRIVGSIATAYPLGVDVDVPTTGGGDAVWSSVALTDADLDGRLHGALTTVAPEGQALHAFRLDSNVEPPSLVLREVDRFSRPGINAISADMIAGRPVLAARIEDPLLVRYYWLDGELAELTRWELAIDGIPFGAGGETTHAIALYERGFDVALRVAIVDAPGDVRGAARPLANGLQDVRSEVWSSAPGVLSVAFRRAGIEVLTFCERAP